MRPSWLWIGVLICAPASEARAENAATCNAAAIDGQELRDVHKLLEARERFRVCAQPGCPAFIAKDCTAWLEELNRSLPTVVLAARDAGGAYMADVAVRVDGRPFVTELDGRAQAMNPGMHVFRFERRDGTAVEQSVPVREGEKNQSVTVTFDKTSAPGPTPERHEKQQEHAEEEPRSPSQPFPWKTVGWVTGGLGVVGLGIGTVFGLMVGSDKSKANCDAAGYCDAGPLASARDHATISTIAFVAGGVLLAGGAALVLFAPSGDSTKKGARAVLTGGPHSATAVIEGAW